MRKQKLTIPLSAILTFVVLFGAGCQSPSAETEMDALMNTIEGYETAWAEGDFLKVDTFFADNARRLHT